MATAAAKTSEAPPATEAKEEEPPPGWGSDDRISFDTAGGKYLLTEDDGSEMEWNAKYKAWVEVVSRRLPRYKRQETNNRFMTRKLLLSKVPTASLASTNPPQSNVRKKGKKKTSKMAMMRSEPSKITGLKTDQSGRDIPQPSTSQICRWMCRASNYKSTLRNAG